MKSLARLAIGILFLAAIAPASAQEVSGAEHWIEHGGIKLYVWEKYAGSSAGKPIAVLAHGSATAGKESFAAAQVEVKSATGPQLDMVTLMPMVNPRLITVPMMIIHGEYDDVADLEGLLPFFEQLPSKYKRYVVVPKSGHMMHLQKGHQLFQHEVASFFKAP